MLPEVRQCLDPESPYYQHSAVQGISPLSGALQQNRWGVINPRNGGQWCSDADIPGWVVVTPGTGDESSVRQCTDQKHTQYGAIAMQVRNEANEPVPDSWVVMNPRNGLHSEIEAKVADWTPLVVSS